MFALNLMIVKSRAMNPGVLLIDERLFWALRCCWQVTTQHFRSWHGEE